MKTLSHLLSLSLSLSLSLVSCASADKLLDRGDYDALISQVTKKMAGKKKKDKYVIALEEGFDKMIRRDMARIEALRLANRPEDWEAIIRVAHDIERKQNRIEPFLPLVSENGYQAKFTFVRTDKIITEAKNTAVALYEKQLEDMVVAARKGNKKAARQAFNLIDHIRSLSDGHYRPELRDEMWSLGINKVFVRIENQSPAIIPAAFEEELLSADFANYGGNWDRFYTRVDGDVQMDYEVVLKILDIATTHDEWAERQFQHHKDIVDGWEYVLDERGNVKKDSLGNDIKKDKIVRVHATVVETLQSKRALIRARMEVTHIHNGTRTFSQPLELENVFTHTARHFFGDERALEPNLRQRIPPIGYPSDASMVWDALQGLKPKFFSEVRRINYSAS